MKKVLKFLAILIICISVYPNSVLAETETEFKSCEWDDGCGVLWSIDFNDCKYIVSDDGVLMRYDKLMQTSEELTREVSSFITDNKTIYYQSYEKNGIYKLDISTREETKVYNGKAFILDCWKNKYLYYYISEFIDYGYREESAWILDLETGESRQWLDYENNGYELGDFVICNDRIYFSDYSSSHRKTDLYSCEVNCINIKTLVTDICGFEIIGNKIYYAKCNEDWGNGIVDFYMMMSDLDGGNAVKISDEFKKQIIRGFTENGVTLNTDWGDIEIPYNIPKEITVTIDGKEVEFDQPPIIVDDRTLVPVRAIFEALGATVDWEGTTQTVISTRGETTISMTIGKTEMYKNGKKIVLDVPPQLVSDRTLVPARAVAESFGCIVDWDGDSRTVIITTAN